MINRRQRFKIEAVKPPKQDPQARVHNFNEVSQPYTPELAMEQRTTQTHLTMSPKIRTVKNEVRR